MEELKKQAREKNLTKRWQVRSKCEAERRRISFNLMYDHYAGPIKANFLLGYVMKRTFFLAFLQFIFDSTLKNIYQSHNLEQKFFLGWITRCHGRQEVIV